jgi:RHS repeat-associated protein
LTDINSRFYLPCFCFYSYYIWSKLLDWSLLVRFFKKFIVFLFTLALTFAFITPSANALTPQDVNTNNTSDLSLTKRSEYIGDDGNPGFNVEYTGGDNSYSYLEVKDETTQEVVGHCYLNYYTKTCTIDLSPSGQYYYTESPFTTVGKHTYKAYLHLENTQVVESNSIEYERKPLTLTLSSTSPDFGRNTYANYSYALNQNVNGSSHSVFVVDLTDNRVLSDGKTFNNPAAFNFGPTHYYQAYFAKMPRNADGTLKANPTRGELTDILATSNVISLSRQPWKVVLWTYGGGYPLEAGTSKGGGQYTTYIVENATGKILTYNVDSSYDYYLDYPSAGHEGDSSWATAYVARVWATDQGGDGIEPHYLSDLKDIQADSNGYSLKTSVVNDPEETQGGANPSQQCAQGCHGDPINTATGEFFENIKDLATPGAGITPNASRSYAVSRSNTSSTMGFGWINSYDMKLYAPDNATISTSNKLKIKQENGSIINFQKLSDGTWETNAATQATLNFVNNQYVLTRNKVETFIFDADGKLIQTKDAYTSVINFGYTNDKLTSATDTKGNTITFAYNTDGYIESASDGIGNTIAYAYDATGRLITATNSNGVITNYTYDSNNRMTSQTNPLGGTTSNEYDGSNRVVKQTDPLGNVMTFDYVDNGDTKTTTITYPDSSVVKETYYKGQLSTKTVNPSTPNERTWKYNYNDANQLISLVNPDGTSNSSLYDGNGNVVQSIDSLGRTTKVSYNEFNKPLTVEDAAGNITTNTYDTQGNLASTTNALGETTSYTHNADGAITSATDAKGNAVGANPADHTSVFGYSDKGLLTTTTNALGQTSVNNYDALGRIVENISPRGMEAGVNQNDFKNTVAYNSLNLPASTIDPLGNETSLTYDAMGNVLSSKDALRNVSTYTYDVMGNMLTKTNALQQTISYHYDNMNRVDSITDANGKVSTITYDILGKVVETKDVLQRSTKQEWDKSGNLVASIDNNNARTEYSYDILGNLISTKSPTGDTSTMSYDVLNRLVSVKDAEGKETKTEYDALSRPVKTINPDQTFTTTTYDSVGNVISTTDEAGKVRTWEYDNLGRKTKYIDETQREESYAYDAASNLTSKTRADGSVVNYVYDTRNLLTTVDYPGTDADINYTYDALGRKLTEQKGTEPVSTYAYDAIGQLSSRGPPNNKVSYAYDVLGNITKLTYPSGREVNYAYDDASQLTSLADATLGNISYAYDSRGNETSITLPNGVIESNIYDANSRRTSVNIAKGNDAIYSKSQTYSTVGNIIQQGKTGSSIAAPTLEDFTYDPLSRITAQKNNSDGSSDNSYGYDAVGNLTTINDSTQSFDDSGKILTSGTKTFGYDALNNRTSETLQSATSPSKNYAWSVENLLSEVAKPADSKTINYTYDAQGLLATRSENAVVTNTFTWDSKSSIPTMLSDGEYEYIYGNSRVPLAQIRLSDNEVKYLHADVNGSVTASTDVNGNASGSVVYSPYGTTTDAPISHFGFAGEWTDKDTGHSYLRARWLDTSTGTFLSEDPLTQSTGQTFGYTAGNPLQQIDPLGLCSILAGDLANLGSDCYSFADTPAFQTITDSVAGFGDAASMGGTSAIRALYGLNNVVNTCSSSYSVGELAGTAASLVIPGGGEAKAGEMAFAKAGKNVGSRLSEVRKEESGAVPLFAVQVNPAWNMSQQVFDKLVTRSKFRTSVLKELHEKAPKNAAGEIICSICNLPISNYKFGMKRKGIVDVDHIKSWRQTKEDMVNESVAPTRTEVLDEYNKTSNLCLTHTYCNQVTKQ